MSASSSRCRMRPLWLKWWHRNAVFSVALPFWIIVSRVYLQKRRDLYPLQMILRELLIMDQSEGFVDSLNNKTASQYLLKEIVKYCTIVVSTVPILIVYPFIQKYFVKGVMLGALKE